MRARVVGLRESAVVVNILRMKKELRHLLLLWSSHCRLSAKKGDHLSWSLVFFFLTRSLAQVLIAMIQDCQQIKFD